VLVWTVAAPAVGGDWPQWRYDAGHTAASPDALPGELHLQWTRQYSPREPVWDDPLNRDMMPYDRIFEPVVAQGRMFLSFNDADKVVALDVRDGGVLWAFYAEGPVRFPPVVFEDSVLFTSDDGYLYCVGAADGKLRWRFLGGPSERKVVGNRRLISSWPARGGPVVADGTVYFAASIWPFMGTFIYALEARTGQVRWRNDATGDQYQKQPHAAPSFGGVAPQGQLAVAGELLLVPGGRSLPAGFDRASGELKFFSFGDKGQGGSFVAADATRAFVHTRVRGTMALSLPKGTVAKFPVNEPVLAGEVLYAAAGATTAKSVTTPPRLQAYDSKNQVLWHLDADGTGDLIRAGNRLYAAGGGRLTAVDLPGQDGPARVAWTQSVEGEVCRLVAAADRLFAVTLDGRVLAFGETRAEPPLAQRSEPLPPDGQSVPEATRLLDSSGKREGYALWFGVDDEELLAAVTASSQLHIVGVDPDAEKIDRLRRRLDQAGWYGRRIALQVGSPHTYLSPPYCAELIVVGRSMAPALRDPQRLTRLYELLRPYGGKLWIQTTGTANGLQAGDLAIGELAQAKLSAAEGALILSREGPLPGAGQWTHAYGDVANTVKSNDRRVKLPLGLQWFGGSSNEDVLPRHGHGPSPQVFGGRLFIQGINSLSARDVYTGRVLWKREFENLDSYQVYYDESFANTPLSTAYSQLHIPGANSRGTNYVAADDGVYLVVRERCLLLEASSGRTLREFVLPPGPDGQSPRWGYIGVYGDLLLAGTGFGDYSQRLGYSYTALPKRGVAWSPDRSGSLGLLAFNRHRGEVAWRVEARHSFLHNGIVAGGGRIYLLDKLPKRVEDQYRRRGTDAPVAKLLAIDARTGAPVWTREENVFGTWLSYSQEHDLLLQAGAAAADRSPDEVDRGLAVHRAGDGSVVWSNAELAYAGPCILHGETLITNTNSYRESKGALHLLDGSPITVDDPVTGESLPWKFTRAYGCNTAVASEYLLTFRSGAAGFYDLENHGGTGNFGGFKSGCSSNLIIADGVLSAPDYTRTCSCAYQNQTSLALVPMPENEVWTYGMFGRSGGQQAEVRRIGINLGAPGDRLSGEGTWWMNYPPDEGVSPAVDVKLEGEVRWFRTHSSRVSGDGLGWVAASGAEGIRKLTVRLELPRPALGEVAVPLTDSPDDAEESAAGVVDLISSELELPREKAPQIIGLRFPKVPLDPGTKIKRAYVQFEAGKDSDEPTRLEIRGHAADDAPPFSTAAFNISQRPVTEAVAIWEPKAWTANAKPGSDHRSADLSQVVQEIVNRPGWKRGNAVALIIRGSGRRVATSTDGEQEGATTLVLETAESPAGTAADSAPDGKPSEPRRRFTVRLHFLEPDAARQPGQRVFDVALQGRPVLSGLDVVAAAGGSLRPLVRSFDGIPAENELEITLNAGTNPPPVLSGVEIVEQPQ
jgi:outer membrane protein assembly factor BamB